MDLDEGLWTNGGIADKKSSEKDEPGLLPAKEDDSAKAGSPKKDKTPVKADSSAEKEKHRGSSTEKKRDRSAERERHRNEDRSSEREKHSDKIAEKNKDRSAEKEEHRSAERKRDRSAEREKHRERNAEKEKHRDGGAERGRSSESEKKTGSSKTNKESPEKRRKEGKVDESRSTNKPLQFPNLKRKAESEVSPKDTKMAKTESADKGSASKSSDSPSTSTAPRVPLTPQERGELWVDKHKPTSLKHIIGQQGDNSNVQKLLKWLASWHKHHGPGVTKKPTRPGKLPSDNSTNPFPPERQNTTKI